MNENQNLFADIPNLGDAQGLQTFMENQAMSEMGITPAQTQPEVQPQVGQQQPQGTQQVQPTQGNQPAQGSQPQTQQYSAEDIQRIIAENQMYRAQFQNQNQPRVQQPVMQQPQPRVQANPQLNQLIANALAQGYTPEQIYAAINNKQPNLNSNAQLEGKLNQVVDYLARQQYEQERNAFVDKMTAFGDKWGLSEQDLVLFANTALEKGMNVATVKDVEAVFRAIYPEQYALRLQRMQNQSGSQIYGGAVVQEAPRAAQSKIEDAYVEQFLQNTMPNQYRNFKK
jgi:hypothetical protein